MSAGRAAGSVRTSYRRLLGFLRPHRLLFAGSLLCMVAAALFDAFSLTLLIPFLRSLFEQGSALPEAGRNLAERVIDGTVGGWLQADTELGTLRNVCLVVLGALLFKNLFLYLARLQGVVVQERVERDLRDRVHASLHRMPLAFFTARRSGQLVSRVLNDTREAKRVVSFGLSDVLRHLVTALAYLVYMVSLSWRLTALAALAAPLLVLLLRPLLRRLRRGFRRVYDRQGEMLSLLEETIAGIRLVKAYGAEEHERRRFEESSAGFARGLIRTEALGELASPLSEVLSAVVALVLLWVGAGLVLGEAADMRPEGFVTFIALALALISPVKAIAAFPTKIQSALAAADRFFEVVDAPGEPLEPVAAEAAPVAAEAAPVAAGAAPVAAGAGPVAARAGRVARPPEREIRFRDVWFSYEPDRPVLRGVDLVVPRGEVVAVVGPSGAGKSTLMDLLPRFVDPERGRVELDGVDLRAFTLPSLRALMGVVSQETVVFHDTVRANIAYGAEDRFPDEAIWEAARAAQAEDFVRALPRGLDTPLGDRGVRLSGGQRQRIGVARAVLRDPPILILDEATSNLDAESERLVREALGALLRGGRRTVFVIAHRLSTVREADRIVVMDRGRVVESGSHDRLYQEGGLYRHLCELQLTAG